MNSLGTRRVLAEFGIIVAGVLTALAVDSCAEGRREASLERQYLVRIEHDLAANVKSLDDAQLFYTRVSGRARTALELLQNDTSAANATHALVVLYHASRGDQPEIVETTYEELVSSGQLRLIRNAGLRDLLVQYHLDVNRYLVAMSGWQDRDPYRDRLRRAVPADLQLTIASTCRIEVQDVRTCNQVAPADRAEAILARLVSDAELAADLNLWVAAQPSIAAATRRQTQATRHLLNAVRTELKK